uniref:Uncharacterized protein n=1 Tax=Romanomermis culicivorax TaxID=13658 RepID=A0A915L6W1_ROMCU
MDESADSGRSSSKRSYIIEKHLSTNEIRLSKVLPKADCFTAELDEDSCELDIFLALIVPNKLQLSTVCLTEEEPTFSL